MVSKPLRTVETTQRDRSAPPPPGFHLNAVCDASRDVGKPEVGVTGSRGAKIVVPIQCKKVKVKERIVLREIHLRTTGRHLSTGSHSVICHPTEATAPPSPQPDRLVLDLSTP